MANKYVVSIGAGIDFAPAGLVEEILQNVRTILSTRIGTVPLDRDFGTSWDVVDAPMAIAQTRLRLAAAEAIERFEPRAKVVKVDFDPQAGAAMDELAKARVTVEIEDSDA